MQEIDYDHPLIWAAYQRGDVCGTFQTESFLGGQYCKKLKPSNIEELSDVISLIRPGPLRCISGDSRIMSGTFNCARSGKVRPTYKSIEQYYNQYIKIKKTGLCGHATDGLGICSYDENNKRLFKNNIREVHKCGIKEVYEVIIKYRHSGDNNKNMGVIRSYKIKSTLDHQFLTLDRGWQKLKDIIPGEYLIVSNKSIICKFKRIHEIEGYKSFKDICYQTYRYKCLFCDWQEGGLDTNHIDGNRYTNNSSDNLCFLCPNHHRLYSENKVTRGKLIELKEENRLLFNDDVRCVRFIGTKFVCEEQTYDISVKGPWHNYIAGNFIVHNSGETDLYEKRKMGKEPVEYLHPSLEPILKDTYGVICYQESCAKIAMDIAGFSEAESVLLVKAISKKNPEEISKIKGQFITKATEKGIVIKEIAVEIFEKIQRFQRYGFNKSHGILYAMNSAASQFYKQTEITAFYCSWLTFANEKQDPIEQRKLLIDDAKLHNIKVSPPIITRKNIDFEILKDREIIFGLSHIRGVGGAAQKSLQSAKVDTWPEFVRSVKKLKRNVVEAFIKSGAADCYQMSRINMLRAIHVLLGRTDKEALEHNPIFSRLTENEWKYFLDSYEDCTIGEALKMIIDHGICSEKRIPIIEEKIRILSQNSVDSNKQKYVWETIYMGSALSCSPVDDINLVGKGVRTCKEVYFAPNDFKAKVYVVLDKLKIKKTSEKSKTPNCDYAIIDISDSSASLTNLPIWPEKYDLFKEKLIEGSIYCIDLKKGRWKDREFTNILSLELVG